MEEEKLRLKKLIEHWAEHNDEHSTRFKESAKKASEMVLKALEINPQHQWANQLKINISQKIGPYTIK